jgi:hypothetical protein
MLLNRFEQTGSTLPAANAHGDDAVARFRRAISLASVPTMREPVMPNGISTETQNALHHKEHEVSRNRFRKRSS